MNNYIILNGINSNTITGLIIQSLPPISKPLMRTNIETIDGKDGDIITKLGYSAYDKEISIGLSYNYNVDDVIEFFNSEGTVIFSNEPTKYYKYTILDQIDFNRLIRFKTATVRMHVQPFKYSTTEEDIEENATETDAEGVNFTLENTENGAGFIDLKLKGQTEQKTYSGANLLPQDKYISSTTTNGITYTNNGDGTFNLSGTATANTTIRIIPIGDLTLESNQAYYLYSSQPYNVSIFNVSIALQENGTTNRYITANNTYTTPSSFTNPRLQFYIASGLSVNAQNVKLMLVKGSTAPSEYEQYVGGIPAPNPSYPQDINVVTGDNTVTLCGKNLFEYTTQTEDGWYTDIPNCINKVGTYTLSFNNNSLTGNWAVYFINSSKQRLGEWIKPTSNVLTPSTFTVTQEQVNAPYIRILPNASGLHDIQSYKIQIEKGNQATTYEPYKSQSYTLSLGDIELCKIGDYQDYIYPANNTWYIHKDIVKGLLNGTETWNKVNNAFQTVVGTTQNKGPVYLNAFSNYFIHKYYQTGITTNMKNGEFGWNSGKILTMRNDSCSNANDFKTWLSNNNVSLYYVAETPTDTEITDATLLSQLNALKGATTYEGQTNIITAGDLQPIIYVKTFAMDNPSYTVTNSGNYFAKPVMTIYGMGTVGVYLDGVQVLSLNLNENQTDHITIDVPNMNAYTDTINTLRNRAVTGDYNNLKFNVGDNELSFSGTIQGFIIQNYSRWL